ncbi:YicC family protein [bacterium]|nr:MAG: YicC family protein [bacterium]
MIISMTGFGKAEINENGHTITVEIKSVNNRYCDISIYLPQPVRSLEPKLKDIIQQKVQRGKLNVSVRIEKQNEAEIDIDLNPKVVQSYMHLLGDLKKFAQIDDPVRLDHLLTFKDIFAPKEETEEEMQILESLLCKAVEKAVDDLNTMRSQEGSHLSKDLAHRIDVIEQKVDLVKTRASERIPEIRQRMKERLKQLLEDEQFDSNRMEMELAVMAERLDITEEIVRMGSHIKYYRKAIDSAEPVGRKLNFLIQEMNREINTMGSKCNDAEIAHEVVDMKEQLEIIREQIQNIE